MRRRDFMRGTLAAAAAARFAVADEKPHAPVFSTRNPDWQRTYDHALEVLRGNVQVLPPRSGPRFAEPVLIEGAEYPGVWQECAPLEGLVYRRWNPQAAANNHLAFFALQREDGQLPASYKKSETGFGQIQMVVPIAATAWELADATGNDELLHKAYDACSRWDAWLLKYRNTRGTGLVEGFCTYDTGMDNSPRWKGVVNQCPGKDATKFVPGQGTPRLCPDLSATVYGGRIALAKMARALGNGAQADYWEEKAAAIRNLILSKLYVEDEAAFYDLDADDKFVRVRTCALARVCGEHVVSPELFDRLWVRQLHKPEAFWGPYPLPSLAMDDPLFVRPIPRNSWGGASQALTALRAPRWMEFYGRTVELAQMMEAWTRALLADGTFRQQLDPLTGVFTEGGSKGYSPAALVLLDYTWRLAGIREDGDQVEWNIRPTCPAAQGAKFSLKLRRGRPAEMRYTRDGAELEMNGKRLATVTGTARVVTQWDGTGIEVIGTMPQEQTVSITRSKIGTETLKVGPNEKVRIRA